MYHRFTHRFTSLAALAGAPIQAGERWEWIGARGQVVAAGVGPDWFGAIAGMELDTRDFRLGVDVVAAAGAAGLICGGTDYLTLSVSPSGEADVVARLPWLANQARFDGLILRQDNSGSSMIASGSHEDRTRAGVMMYPQENALGKYVFAGFVPTSTTVGGLHILRYDGSTWAVTGPFAGGYAPGLLEETHIALSRDTRFSASATPGLTARTDTVDDAEGGDAYTTNVELTSVGIDFATYPSQTMEQVDLECRQGAAETDTFVFRITSLVVQASGK